MNLKEFIREFDVVPEEIPGQENAPVEPSPQKQPAVVPA